MITLEQAKIILDYRIACRDGMNYNNGYTSPHPKEEREVAKICGKKEYSQVKKLNKNAKELIKCYLFALAIDFKEEYGIQPKELRKLAKAGYVKEIGMVNVSTGIYGYSRNIRLAIYKYSAESFFDVERLQEGYLKILGRELILDGTRYKDRQFKKNKVSS